MCFVFFNGSWVFFFHKLAIFLIFKNNFEIASDNRFNRSRNVYGDCFYGDEMKSNNKKNDDLLK